MEALREFVATFIYIVGLVLVFSIFDEFFWKIFFAGIACFVTAYFIWPSKSRGQREQENSFIDILEIVIELPVETFKWLFRLLGRMFRNKDGDFDIDIDL